MRSETIKGIEFYQVKSDLYGNQRYVVHYFNFLTIEECKKYDLLQGYKVALIHAKKAGFKIYRGKDFGGGFVVQSRCLTDTANRIIHARCEQ